MAVNPKRFEWTSSTRVLYATQLLQFYTTGMLPNKLKTKDYRKILSELIAHYPQEFTPPPSTHSLKKERAMIRKLHTYLVKHILHKHPELKFDKQEFEVKATPEEWKSLHKEQLTSYGGCLEEIRRGRYNSALRILHESMGGFYKESLSSESSPTMLENIDYDSNDDNLPNPKGARIEISGAEDTTNEPIIKTYQGELHSNICTNQIKVTPNNIINQIGDKDNIININIQSIYTQTTKSNFEKVWERLCQLQYRKAGIKQGVLITLTEQDIADLDLELFYIHDKILDFISLDVPEDDINFLAEKTCLDDRRFLLFISRIVRNAK